MNEWTVVGVIIALVGLFCTVGAPILKLNKNIVELNVTMKSQGEEIKANKKALDEQKEHARESHKRLWDHNEKQDDMLTDHETRIKLLEETEG